MLAAEKFLSMARAALAGATPTVTSLPPAPRPSRPEPVTARPQMPPAPFVLPTFASALQVLNDRHLTSGARRLWHQLHRLALDVARSRGYAQLVHQVVYHCPAVTLCGLLGVTDRHLRRLTHELEAVGLLDAGGHSQQVVGRSMYDGTLWAVLMLPAGDPPRIRAEEWRHNWRPDFAADVEGKTGARAEMSELLNQEVEEEEKYQAAKARAAVPAGKNLPPLSSSDILPRPSLRAVVEGLGQLWHLHSSKRARAVGVLASSVAAALSEPDRRRYWCRVIWEAMRSENESRGGLQALAAQFSRLEADLNEGAPWKNPGAVLAARLKVA